jgi:2-oxoacid:acceptor oxidoreductase gamma subunit (pyruvate/2-ketoisovalerate family)
MEEIRFHGRGGQGSVIGSEVLAHAFFHEGCYVQAFPAFGVERRGAPVTAFCRIDDRPIHLRNQIYRPDHVVVLDASMIGAVNVTEGLKPGGTVLINTARAAGHYGRILGQGYRIFIVDASAIAVAHHLGSASNPIVNTAILGAFAKATGLVGIEAVAKAIGEHVPVNREQNRQAARAAYEQVVQG